MIRLSL